MKAMSSSSRPRFALSIHHKLIALIVALMIGVVGVLAIYLTERQIDTMTEALNRRATTYGSMLAKQAASAVAFDDRETAREVLHSIDTDPDVAAVGLFGDGGARLYLRGTLTMPDRFVDAARIWTSDSRIAVATPVVSVEGPRGTLVIELSTAALHAARAGVMWAAIAVGAAALGCGIVIAWLIARRLARGCARSETSPPRSPRAISRSSRSRTRNATRSARSRPRLRARGHRLDRRAVPPAGDRARRLRRARGCGRSAGGRGAVGAGHRADRAADRVGVRPDRRVAERAEQPRGGDRPRRRLVTPSRWDRFPEGDQEALTAAEVSGLEVFTDVGCMTCHTGELVGASTFQKVGVSAARGRLITRRARRARARSAAGS
jgi:hypothetical protein